MRKSRPASPAFLRALNKSRDDFVRNAKAENRKIWTVPREVGDVMVRNQSNELMKVVSAGGVIEIWPGQVCLIERQDEPEISIQLIPPDLFGLPDGVTVREMTLQEVEERYGRINIGE